MRNLITLACSLSLCTSLFAQPPAYVPTDGLMSWWPFNGNADDESGNGNHGSIIGVVDGIPDRAGSANSAIHMDQVGSGITLLPFGSWLAGDRTVSFWFRSQYNGPYTPWDEMRIMNYRPNCLGGNEQWLAFDITSGNTLRQGQGGGNGYTEGSFEPNTWTMVTSVKENGVGKLYLNAELAGIHSVFDDITQAGGTLAISSASVCISGFAQNDTRYRGDLDDVGVWTRALSASEIADLFQGGNAMPTSHSCGAANVHNPEVEYGTMTDQDGNHYKTVQVGEQVWMAENLMVDHFRNGDVIPEIPASGGIWNGTSSPASCWFNDDRAAFACPYGKMYNWYVAGDNRNVCPAGWRVPSSADFETLVNTLGASAGGKMKSQGIQYWTGGNLGGSNASGFSGLPAGTRWQDSYGELGILAHYWTSTSDMEGQVNSTLVRLHYDGTGLDFFTWDNRRGEAIRCIQDNTSTGILQGSNELPSLLLFPNPTNGVTTLAHALNGTVTITVLDALGRRVHNEVFRANGDRTTRRLDLSGLAPGSYTFTIRNTGAVVSQRVVIQ